MNKDEKKGVNPAQHDQERLTGIQGQFNLSEIK